MSNDNSFDLDKFLFYGYCEDQNGNSITLKKTIPDNIYCLECLVKKNNTTNLSTYTKDGYLFENNKINKLNLTTKNLGMLPNILE